MRRTYMFDAVMVIYYNYMFITRLIKTSTRMLCKITYRVFQYLQKKHRDKLNTKLYELLHNSYTLRSTDETSFPPYI